MKTPTPFRILVVEDDPGLREFTSEWLGEAGYETRTAENGLKALEQLDQLAWHPDLILLDLAMPVLDGWQFLERLTASTDAAQPTSAGAVLPPVIVLTGAFRRQAGIPRGASAMLEKPYDFDLLGRSIATYAGAVTG